MTVLANELNKEHDVFIMTGQSRKAEDRTLNGLDEDVEVLFYESKEFSRGVGVLEARRAAAIKKINESSGLFNRRGVGKALVDALLPPAMRKQYIDFVNGQDFDVVVATATTALLLAVIAPELNAKTIGWQHSTFESYFGTEKMLFWKQEALAKRYFPNLDRYIVLTEYDVRAYEEKLRLTTIDMNNPVTISGSRKSPLVSKKFLIAARLEQAKGVDIAIRAFEKYCGFGGDWDLVIAGDGTMRNALIRYVWGKGLTSRVHFVGTVSDMEQYYLDSSVYLMTSRWEGWGLVVTEAFSMGVPVIAFDIHPMDLIIDDGVDGMLVTPFDEIEYAKAMLQLSRDDDVRARMGAAAPLKAEKYSIDKYVAKWKALLEEVCRN